MLYYKPCNCINETQDIKWLNRTSEAEMFIVRILLRNILMSRSTYTIFSNEICNHGEGSNE